MNSEQNFNFKDNFKPTCMAPTLRTGRIVIATRNTRNHHNVNPPARSSDPCRANKDSTFHRNKLPKTLLCMDIMTRLQAQTASTSLSPQILEGTWKENYTSQTQGLLFLSTQGQVRKREFGHDLYPSAKILRSTRTHLLPRNLLIPVPTVYDLPSKILSSSGNLFAAHPKQGSSM